MSDKIYSNKISISDKVTGKRESLFTLEHRRGFGVNTMIKLFRKIEHLGDKEYAMRVFERDGRHTSYLYDIILQTDNNGMRIFLYKLVHKRSGRVDDDYNELIFNPSK